jgi:hypothetical protein
MEKQDFLWWSNATEATIHPLEQFKAYYKSEFFVYWYQARYFIFYDFLSWLFQQLWD